MDIGWNFGAGFDVSSELKPFTAPAESKKTLVGRIVEIWPYILWIDRSVLEMPHQVPQLSVDAGGKLVLVMTQAWKDRNSLWLQYVPPEPSRIARKSDKEAQMVMLQPYPAPLVSKNAPYAVPLAKIQKIERNNVHSALTFHHVHGTFGPFQFVNDPSEVDALLLSMKDFIVLSEENRGAEDVFTCSDPAFPSWDELDQSFDGGNNHNQSSNRRANNISSSIPPRPARPSSSSLPRSSSPPSHPSNMTTTTSTTSTSSGVVGSGFVSPTNEQQYRRGGGGKGYGYRNLLGGVVQQLSSSIKPQQAAVASTAAQSSPSSANALSSTAVKKETLISPIIDQTAGNIQSSPFLLLSPIKTGREGNEIDSASSNASSSGGRPSPNPSAFVIEDLIEGVAEISNKNKHVSYPQIETTSVGDFEFLDDISLNSTPRTPIDGGGVNNDQVKTPARDPSAPAIPYSGPMPHRGNPLTYAQLEALVDEDGKITDVSSVKESIFYGGLDDRLRPFLWKFMFGMYGWDSTAGEREMIQRRRRTEYDQIKSHWKNMLPEAEAMHTVYRERKSLIEKDVVRTDREHTMFSQLDGDGLKVLNDALLSYAMFNFDLGYVQGMSDIMAPLIAVLGNEVDVFWCFHGMMISRLLMHFRLKAELHAELFQVGKLVQIAHPKLHGIIRNVNAEDMLFAFRWLLVDFKREFSFQDTIHLWDVIWSGYLTKRFNLFVACSMLLLRASSICERDDMDGSINDDELLLLANTVSGTLSLREVLLKAEWTYHLCKDYWNEEKGCLEVVGEEPLEELALERKGKLVNESQLLGVGISWPPGEEPWNESMFPMTGATSARSSTTPSPLLGLK